MQKELNLIPKTHNYFISKSGHVYKIINGKEVKLNIEPHHKNGMPYVKINGIYKSLLQLMVDNYLPEIKATQTLSYSIGKDLSIPLSSIKVKTILNDWISDDDERIMINFKCSIKASAANSRCKNVDILTPLQVFLSLKIHEFKCVYCGDFLKETDWHLEHYVPLSKGGKNVFNNILPSCSICNFMKHNLNASKFYNQCLKISKNYLFKNDLSARKQIGIDSLEEIS